MARQFHPKRRTIFTEINNSAEYAQDAGEVAIMDTSEFYTSSEYLQPDFYLDVFGQSFSAPDIDRLHNNIPVENLGTGLTLASIVEKIKQYPGCEVYSDIEPIFGGRIAVIKCPDSNIIILTEGML